MKRFWDRLLQRQRGSATDPPAQSAKPSFVRRHPIFITTLGVLLLGSVGTFLYVYLHYARMIEDKLGDGGMRTNSSIYASPKLVEPGDALSTNALITHLQAAGYTDRTDNPIGWYRTVAHGVEVHSGTASYFQPHAATISLSGDRVSSIFSQTERKNTDRFYLEPVLVTNLFDEDRGKRRPVAYSELPKHLVHALISIEDKRFFNHSGLDLLRLGKAAYVDIKEGRKEQGASTITMQLARSFWLDQDKNWRRKMAEVFLTAELERRFSKEKILELYANEVYLGRRGSFSIHGFGEASRAYFGKDVRELTLSEAALLAGIIQRPGYFNPFRNPERVKERRDLTLTLMHGNGYIDSRQLTEAQAAPIKLHPAETESSDAPYFVDLLDQDLQDRFQDWDFSDNGYRVYSTLDLELQQIAVDAVRIGMQEVDRNIAKKRGKDEKGPLPQVALVAVDPHTGAIKAVVGGRNYTTSQLNHAESKRQPGSSFKPFVYAAGLETGAHKTASGQVITAANRFDDIPTTFKFGNQVYQPANFHDEYHGSVTMRSALAKSMNIPTIKLAEKVGFKNVVDLVKAAGIESPIEPTPSLALGAYEVSPLEIAGAYTIFTNGGAHLKRSFVSSIRDRKNKTVYTAKPEQNQVLDPRVAFIMTDLMSEVLRSGTGAGVRSRGFTLPAAGKTGTSRDGWFVGYTNNLLCAVWIGYDDNAELNLEGAKSAMPVWVEFMKRAHNLHQYANPKPFVMPEGVVRASIDPTTGGLANEYCPSARTEVFLTGTQPRSTCSLHNEFYQGDDPDAYRRMAKITKRACSAAFWASFTKAPG